MASGTNPFINQAINQLDQLATTLRSMASDQSPQTSPQPGTVVQGSNTLAPVPEQVVQRMNSLAQFRSSLSTGNAFSRNARPSNMDSDQEVRRSFLPYQSTSRSATRPRASASGARTSLPNREWNRVLCCLSGPGITKTPTGSQKTALQAAGLGANVLRIATKPLFIQAIRNLFPIMGNIDFELLRSEGGGEGKLLVPVMADTPIPMINDLSLLMGRSIIYVRPKTALLSEEAHDDESSNSAELSSNISLEAPHNSSVTSIHQLQPSAVIEIPNSETGHEGVIVSMDDFRHEMHIANEGLQYVLVHRDNFSEQVLGVYKNPRFSLLKKPHVSFAGEAGADVGALQKEFFWRGIHALSTGRFNNRLPYFEGEADHKLPRCDGVILRAKVFETIGKFIVHSAIQSGLAFVGLSRAVVEYLTLDTVDLETPLTLALEDVPEIEIREQLLMLDKWAGGAPPSQSELASLQSLAESCDFHDKVKVENIAFLSQHILHFVVIWKRRAQLEAMKEAFRNTPLLQFLQGKEYLLDGLFPSNQSLIARPELVADKIICNFENSPIIGFVKEFIITNCDDPKKLGELVSAWTGWAILPEEPLVIKIVDKEDEFCFHSCFQELDIPSDFDKERVFSYLENVMENGTLGFGVV